MAEVTATPCGLSPTEGQDPGRDGLCSLVIGKMYPLTALKEDLGLKFLRSLMTKRNGAGRGDCGNLHLIPLAFPGNTISLTPVYRV